MAPPPKYVITRKLVNRFFKNYLPNQNNHALLETNRLLECWEKLGPGNAKCRQFESELDKAEAKASDYLERLQRLKYLSCLRLV